MSTVSPVSTKSPPYLHNSRGNGHHWTPCESATSASVPALCMNCNRRSLYPSGSAKGDRLASERIHRHRRDTRTMFAFLLKLQPPFVVRFNKSSIATMEFCSLPWDLMLSLEPARVDEPKIRVPQGFWATYAKFCILTATMLRGMVPPTHRVGSESNCIGDSNSEPRDTASVPIARFCPMLRPAISPRSVGREKRAPWFTGRESSGPCTLDVRARKPNYSQDIRLDGRE
jgi:hypothetical protein